MPGPQVQVWRSCNVLKLLCYLFNFQAQDDGLVLLLRRVSRLERFTKAIKYSAFIYYQRSLSLFLSLGNRSLTFKQTGKKKVLMEIFIKSDIKVFQISESGFSDKNSGALLFFPDFVLLPTPMAMKFHCVRTWVWTRRLRSQACIWLSSTPAAHLENYVPFVQVAIFSCQTGTGHFLYEDLAPQPQTIL